MFLSNTNNLHTVILKKKKKLYKLLSMAIHKEMSFPVKISFNYTGKKSSFSTDNKPFQEFN